MPLKNIVFIWSEGTFSANGRFATRAKFILSGICFVYLKYFLNIFYPSTVQYVCSHTNYFPILCAFSFIINIGREASQIWYANRFRKTSSKTVVSHRTETETESESGTFTTEIHAANNIVRRFFSTHSHTLTKSCHR